MTLISCCNQAPQLAGSPLWDLLIAVLHKDIHFFSNQVSLQRLAFIYFMSHTIQSWLYCRQNTGFCFCSVALFIYKILNHILPEILGKAASEVLGSDSFYIKQKGGPSFRNDSSKAIRALGVSCLPLSRFCSLKGLHKVKGTIQERLKQLSSSCLSCFLQTPFKGTVISFNRVCWATKHELIWFANEPPGLARGWVIIHKPTWTTFFSDLCPSLSVTPLC